jgi:hypothetical protein
MPLFLQCFKSRCHFLAKGGIAPSWTPPPLRGGPAYRPGDYAKSVKKDVVAYGRSEDEIPRKCILQAEKHYAWDKKL